MTGLRPVVEARGLTVAGRRGTVLDGLDLKLSAGTLAVVRGRSGSGRSTLLLALTGRLRGLSGSVRVAGVDAVARPDRVRAITGVARVAGLVDLEPRLTVAESLTERSLIDAVPLARAGRAFARAEESFGRVFDRDTLVGDLGAADRTLLTAALATLRPARLVVLDDVDRGLDHAEQVSVLTALAALTARGLTLVATAVDLPSAVDSAGVHLVTLPLRGPDGRDTAPLAAAPATPTRNED